MKRARTLCLLFAVLACGAACQTYDATSVPLVQEKIGAQKNIQDSGAWWGEQIVKVVAYEQSVFTYAYTEEDGTRKAWLYERDAEGSWSKGVGTTSSRPPCLLIDSGGHVHLVGFEPYSDDNPYSGRLYHLRFDSPKTVSESYTKTYITEDSRSAPSRQNVASIFYGAAIGDDNTLITAYENSPDGSTPGNNSLALRISDDSGETWAYEDVATNLSSRFSYPFAFVSPSHFHVLAVEDMYDEDYLSAGEPYESYPYRYGQVRHWQRPRSGGAWEETVLLDFNDTMSKEEIWDAMLRIVEFYVTRDGTAHALLRYKTDGVSHAYHYTKSERDSSWQSETILPEQDIYWAKLWEDADNHLYYLTESSGRPLWLTRLETGESYEVSNLSGVYNEDVTPFPANRRGGTNPSHRLHMVVFGGSSVIEGYYIAADIKNEERSL